MRIPFRLGLIIPLLALTACLRDDEDTSSWFCGFYNTCAKEANNLCAFYGNCPKAGGSVWGSTKNDPGGTVWGPMHDNAESGSVWGPAHSDGGSVWGPAHSDSGDGVH